MDPGFESAIKLFVCILGAMCLLIILTIIVAILEVINKFRRK